MKKYVLWMILVVLTGGLGIVPAHTQANNEQANWTLASRRPIEGSVDVISNVTIAGRHFTSAIAQDASSGAFDEPGIVERKAVFANPRDYDRLEAWIGVRGGTNKGGRHQFIVQGDGETLFTSKWMEQSDVPIKISVSVKGCSGIALIARGNGARYASALWAEAVFILGSSAVPQLLSPQANARLSRNTQLVWEESDGAEGYLLELQATSLNSSRDAQNRNRFIAVYYPAGVTTHLFAVNEMPRGQWRWRVHALSSTGFLGEMKEWRYFTLQ